MMAEKEVVTSGCQQRSSKMRNRASDLRSTPIDANVWSYLKEQLTEKIGLILPREAAGEVDGGGKIRHG